MHLVVQQPAELLLLPGQAGRQGPGPPPPAPPRPAPPARLTSTARSAAVAAIAVAIAAARRPATVTGPPSGRGSVAAVSAPAAPGPTLVNDWLRARPPRSRAPSPASDRPSCRSESRLAAARTRLRLLSLAAAGTYRGRCTLERASTAALGLERGGRLSRPFPALIGRPAPLALIDWPTGWLVLAAPGDRPAGQPVLLGLRPPRAELSGSVGPTVPALPALLPPPHRAVGLGAGSGHCRGNQSQLCYQETFYFACSSFLLIAQNHVLFLPFKHYHTILKTNVH